MASRGAAPGQGTSSLEVDKLGKYLPGQAYNPGGTFERKISGIISDHVNITCYKGRGNDEEEVLQAGPH